LPLQDDLSLIGLEAALAKCENSEQSDGALFIWDVS
jgi:hypothetical protein